jgi:hypothetical protein
MAGIVAPAARQKALLEKVGLVLFPDEPPFLSSISGL